jgi:restriction system protein
MDYRDFKHDKYGLPIWDSMIPVVLQYLSDKQEVSSKTIKVDIANELGLPESLRNKTYEKDPSLIIIEDHIYWCVNELALGGALDRVSRGVYKINVLGRKLLNQNETSLDRELIKSLKKKKDLKLDNNYLHDLNSNTPVQTENDFLEEFIVKADEFNNRVSKDLLKRIQESEPNFFEQLVVKLLIKMGYKGPNGSSKVTQKTNDGGIDGIINQDPLGTSTVYIQAKRYKDDNVVQRPAIDGFFGALSRVHADRGVFITTSHFSNSAISTAKNFSIVLIDGIQLTNLMLQYQVGVQVKRHLNLFEIDEDFFEE